jgi:hypothetical protein
MTESDTGNPPLPLLLYVWVVPEVLVMSTLKEDIEVATGRFTLKE